MPLKRLEGKMPSLPHVRAGSQHHIAGETFHIINEDKPKSSTHKTFLVKREQERFWLHLPKPTETPDAKHNQTAYLQPYPKILIGECYQDKDQFQSITIGQQSWQIGNCIGEGAEARIFEAKHGENQKTYILKAPSLISC